MYLTFKFYNLEVEYDNMRKITHYECNLQRWKIVSCVILNTNVWNKKWKELYQTETSRIFNIITCYSFRDFLIMYDIF